MSRYPSLFSPVRIGSLELPNRVVLAPMGTGYADAEHKVTDRLVAYHVARARGGVGLSIVEHTAVHRLGLTGERMLAILDDSFIPGFRRLTDAIHEAGGGVALQLQHGGRQADPEVIGQECLSASAVASGRDQRVPRAMSAREVRGAVSAFGAGARRAKRAGFDGVEVHMAHGYLGCSFLSPYLNHRTDAYGGSAEKRTRFAAEVIQAVRKGCGSSFPVWCRVSAEEFVEGGQTLAQMQEIAPILERLGYCAIHVSAAIGETSYMASAPHLVPEGHLLALAEGVGRSVGIPVIGVGNIRTPSFADTAVANGRCDLVALGRALLADPEWCNKARDGHEREIIPCLYCNLGCADRRRSRGGPGAGRADAALAQSTPATDSEAGPAAVWERRDWGADGLCECVTNPLTGHESDWPDWPDGPRAGRTRRVVVVGGGPAGMVAAIVAGRRGHDVELWERSATLGGRLLAADSAAPNSVFAGLLQHLAAELDKAGVSVKWQRRATPSLLIDAAPGAVVVATGARPLDASEVLVVAPNAGTIAAAECLLNPEREFLQPVAVLGGDETGCLVASALARRGHAVVIFEQGEELGAGMVSAVRHSVLQRLDEASAQRMVGCRAVRVEAGCVTALVRGEERREFHCGSVVVALGRRSVDELSDLVRRSGVQCHVIGDARTPGTLHDAFWEGAEIGRAI